MILQRVEQADWLSNSYLVIDRPGGHGVLIDGNGVIEPLLERLEREGTTLTHVLLTHDHWDHVVDLPAVAERYRVPILAHEATAERVDFPVTETIGDGDVIRSGELEIEAMFTPGHAAGHLAFLIDGTDLVTADTLFRGTVAGTMAPGATGLGDLRATIMDRYMSLPPETRIHPGHREPGTIGEEWENNPFIRVWRGLDPAGEEPCEVAGLGPATLVLWGPDYDGTNKAWVRFPDGSEGIVGGSMITGRG